MTTLRETTAQIQRRVGVNADGVWGPASAAAVAKALGVEQFDRQAFQLSFINTNAAAITDEDIRLAAVRLGVTKRHIKMLRKVESGGRSFDDRGRPIILFEPHIFYRRTQGRYGSTSFSNRTWDRSLYPKSYDGRWQQMADAAEKDAAAAVESASWGLWQIMGFHWNTLGYESAWDFAASIVKSEAGHLEALVRFIEVNGLQDELAACEAGKPDSCRPFARAYNGTGYAQNNYHVKMAEALR